MNCDHYICYPIQFRGGHQFRGGILVSNTCCIPTSLQDPKGMTIFEVEQCMHFKEEYCGSLYMPAFIVKKFEYKPYSMEDAFTCGVVSWLRRLVDLDLEEEPSPYVDRDPYLDNLETLVLNLQIFILLGVS